MSNPVYLVSGPCQPVSVRIAYPVDVKIPADHFFAYGYVIPGDVNKLRAWLQSCRHPQQRVPGQPVLRVPPPFDWGFYFAPGVPTREFLKLIVEAEDVHGVTTRDVSHLICKPPPYLTVQIGTPASGDSVTRQFSAFGWVSDTSAALSAWVEQPQGTVVNPAGTRVIPPGAQVYDWQFDFNVPNLNTGAAWLVVQAGTGGSAVTDTHNITIVNS
jgi:hypothetical protein